MAARRCINDFSAPSSANIKTGLEANIRDGSFELKAALINMVQQSPLCGKASEDAVRLHLFQFSLLEKEKQWFYSNKEAVSTWEKCSNAFLTKFFPFGKTNALWNKISWFQQLTDETITEAWERMQDYISGCPHHSMEEWFIIQSFYHGLIRSTREHIDAAAGGSFFALNIEEARKLVEKRAPN
jgi:hypothetical protein